jgi:hypothetical protein
MQKVLRVGEKEGKCTLQEGDTLPESKAPIELARDNL